MDLQATIEQVAGILVREGLHFGTHQDGNSYRLLYDRDAVFIHFVPAGEHVRITVACPVLQQIDPESPGAAIALNRLNELNLEHRFLKWTFDAGTLLASVDLLGDHLHSGELLNAVYGLVATVDEVGDELEDETQGWRYDEMCELEDDGAIDELEVEDE